jgi:2-iminoacetate synthase ThiH
MSMGRILSRAIAAAGLGDCQAQALAGAELSADQLARLERADLLLVAGLADAVRERFHGDDVSIAARAPGDAVVFDRTTTEHGATGAELLRELALLRLRTPSKRRVAVSIDALGLELAQTALVFGADTLVGDLGSARILPLLEGVGARRVELEGLVARSGRRARFVDIAVASAPE